jgi:hypothetical protein
MQLHARELPTEARNEVVRDYFSTLNTPSIPHTTRPLYHMRPEEAHLVTNDLPDFNEWGSFLVNGVVPVPCPRTLAAKSEQYSSARELNPGPSKDFNADKDSGELVGSGSHCQSTVVLSLR